MPHMSSCRSRRNVVSTESPSQDKEETIGLFELWPGGSDNAAKLDTKLEKVSHSISILLKYRMLTTSNSIVALHGLNGNPYKTWTDGERFWLQDFLPASIPEARIFTYGYNSKLAFSGCVQHRRLCTSPP